MNLSLIRQFVLDNGLDLHIVGDGVLIVRFPDVKDRTPLLITADKGRTWCPETSIDRASAWVGNVTLTGSELAKEIRSMYVALSMDSPDRMLEVAAKLEEICQGKKFHTV